MADPNPLHQSSDTDTNSDRSSDFGSEKTPQQALETGLHKVAQPLASSAANRVKASRVVDQPAVGVGTASPFDSPDPDPEQPNSLTGTPKLNTTDRAHQPNRISKKSFSLTARINLLGYVISLGCSIVLGLTMLVITTQLLWNNTLVDGRAVADIISLNNARFVATDQLGVVNRRFSNLTLYSSIRGAIMQNQQQETIASYSSDGTEWDIAELTANAAHGDKNRLLEMIKGQDWLALDSPILFGQDQIATLYIVWDLSRPQNHIYQLLKASSAAFIAILILVMIATRHLRKSFSRPVDELLRTTADFAENGTKAQHAAVFANDEMGRLTESYNAMVDRLVSQHGQLSAAHETLEKQVQRRTAQLKAQQSAAESSRKELQLVIDLSLDLLTMIDADGHFTMVSPAVTTLLGYTKEEWIECQWEELMYTPDRSGNKNKQINPKNYLKNQGGKVVDAERRMRHRDGHWIWMEWSLTLLDDDRVFMVGRNIQERKKREIDIMVSHKAETLARKRAQQIVDISLDTIVTIDSSGRLLQVSPAAKRMFGYEPKELLGKRFTDFVSNDDFEGDSANIKSLAEIVMAAGGSLSGVLRRFKHKKGHMVWVEWAVVFQPEEKLIYAVARDMTERRQQEEQLRLAHEKVQEVIDTSRDLIATLDLEGHFLAVSAATERLLGYPAEHLIGKEIREFLNPEDNTMFDFEIILEKMEDNGGGLNGLVRRFKHKNDSWVWMEWNLAGHVDNGEIHATGRDITDRVQYEQELIAAREAAEHATIAKSDFLSNMSHEIRTPLNGVMGMLQLIDDTKVTIEQRGYLRTALNSSDALLTLINDILDFSKMEAGKLQLEDQPFSLIELTEDVVALFGEQAAAKDINLSGFLEDDVPSHIRGDTTRLRQVLTNIISNAMKFTKEGEICCQVSLLDDEDPPMLCFDIIDTGLGIPKDKQEAIFESFSQADNSTTREFGGTGLGLAISKELVALMDGELSVTSIPGKGSTFSIAIPLHPAEQPPFGNPELANKRVLVVCETPNVRESIAVICRRTGMQVIDIPIWQHNLPDLIGDGSAFDIVICDVSLIKNRLGAAWIKKPVLPTLVVAPFGKPLEGLCDRFRQVYKPVQSTMLLSYMESLLQLTQIDRATTTRKIKPPPAKLLLVEDNRVNQKVATRMLEKMDMTVTIAVNGQEAVDRLAEETFDLVLMDCQMPVLDGLAATRQIRQREQAENIEATTIVALTANVDTEHRRQCTEAGMDDYLAKPFRFDGLAATLEKWLKPVKEPWLD